MTLPFEPACLPLTLGSLPHQQVARAIEAIRRYASALPAWPQLPHTSFREHPVMQSAAGFPGLVVDAEHAQVHVDRAQAEHDLNRLAIAYLTNDMTYVDYNAVPAGFTALQEQRDLLRTAQAVKGQLLGPISVAAQLTDEQQRPLIYDPNLLAALTHHIRLQATWQETHLGEHSHSTIICLDEPFLNMVGLPFAPITWDEARVCLNEVFSGVIGCKALFAAGAVAWAEVLETSVELVVADVYAHGAALVEAADALRVFLERDGIVGLGLVPSTADDLRRATPETLRAQLGTLLDQLAAKGIPPTTLLRHAVISTNDGLWMLDVAEAERALELVNSMSALLRDEFHLTENEHETAESATQSA